MKSLATILIIAGPWIVSTDFSQERQAAALNATLRLTNPATNGEGTAVRIGRLGPYVYFLTAQHNLKSAEKAVYLESFAATTYPKPIRKMLVDIKHQWPEIDLALLAAIEPEPPGILPIKKAHQPQAAPFPVLTVGCTEGKIPELMADRALQAMAIKRPDGLKGRFWQTEKRPVEGRSGGPLVDASGSLIGVCSGTSDGKGYYIHLDEIRTALVQAGWEALLAGPSEPKQPEK